MPPALLCFVRHHLLSLPFPFPGSCQGRSWTRTCCCWGQRTETLTGSRSAPASPPSASKGFPLSAGSAKARAAGGCSGGAGIFSSRGNASSMLTIQQPVLLSPLLQLHHHQAGDDMVWHQQASLKVLLRQGANFCAREEKVTQKPKRNKEPQTPGQFCLRKITPPQILLVLTNRSSRSFGAASSRS